jgi:hypothetical protein
VKKKANGRDSAMVGKPGGIPAAAAPPERPAAPAMSTPPRDRTRPQLKPIRIKKEWLWLGLGAALVAAGVVAGWLWQADQRNTLLAFLTIAGFGSGGIMVYRSIQGQAKPGESRVVTIAKEGGAKAPTVDEAKTEKGEVNSLNIYAREYEGSIYPQKIAFEWVDNSIGQKQKCRNNGHWYYVHRWDIGKGQLVPFILPDTRFKDPAVVARYLALPAQRRYLRHRETLGKYIGPGILAALCIAAFVVIIALGG